MPEPHKGKWETILGTNGCALDSEQEAVHANIVHNPSTGTWKVLFYSAFDSPGSDPIKSRIYDPTTATINPITSQDIPTWPAWTPPPDPPQDWKGRIFCSGHVFLSDGKLLVAGGHREPVESNKWARGMPFTYKFDPVTETWSVVRDSTPLQEPVRMADGRWYPTLTKLGRTGIEQDKVLVVSGYKYDYDPRSGELAFNYDVEIYPDANGKWQLLPPEARMPSMFKDVLYPGAHLVPFNNGNIKAGEIFYSMPLQQSWRFNADGQGSPNAYWNTVASSRNFRGHGCSVILPLKPGSNNMKVLILGGTTDEETMPTLEVEVINLGIDTVSWNRTADLYIPRKNANAVILPDGKIFVVGGNQFQLRETAVTIPELYDPEANNGQGNSTILPAMSYQRNYHSTAVLLPDAKVLVSGGEKLCDGIGNGNNNFEVYSPGYLFEGNRPQILTPPPTNITYASQFNLTTDVSIGKVILMRPGTPTHAFDQDQRAIELSFTSGSQNGGIPQTITAPANGNIAPPGYYMLFVLRPKSASSSGQREIPSIAKFVKLS